MIGRLNKKGGEVMNYKLKVVILILLIIFVTPLLLPKTIEEVKLDNQFDGVVGGGTYSLTTVDDLLLEKKELGSGSLSTIQTLLPKMNYKYIYDEPTLSRNYDIVYVFYEKDSKVFYEEFLMDSNESTNKIKLPKDSDVVIALSDYYMFYHWTIKGITNHDNNFFTIKQYLDKTDYTVDGGLPFSENLLVLKAKSFSNDIELEYKSVTGNRLIYKVTIDLK